jgi:autotransporter adhesin
MITVLGTQFVLGDFKNQIGYFESGKGATGDNSTALGYNTWASGGGATALGSATVASGPSSTALGGETVASGNLSTAMGYESIASGDYSTAIGFNSTASNDLAIAMGYFSTASGFSSTSIGWLTDASANYSLATGSKSVASGVYSTAIGNNAWTDENINFAVGASSFVPEAIATANSNNNKLVILNNGNVGIGTNSPTVALYVNGDVTAAAYNLISDDRLKHNEQDITTALDIILKLEPKQYIKTPDLYDANHHFILNSSGNPVDSNGNPIENYSIESGFIAQDILKIDELKHAVSGGDTSDSLGNIMEKPYSVRYNDIHIYHIRATQELHAKNAMLDTRLSAMEARLTAAGL